MNLDKKTKRRIRKIRARREAAARQFFEPNRNPIRLRKLLSKLIAKLNLN